MRSRGYVSLFWLLGVLAFVAGGVVLNVLKEELPKERTRLLDNLGRVRQEIGPVTPELADALADAMNIRRGEVHEVTSFYSFLQVPADATRVCTGPVCDCAGAHADGALADFMAEMRAARRRRGEEMVHRLRRLGVDIGNGNGFLAVAENERGGEQRVRRPPRPRLPGASVARPGCCWGFSPESRALLRRFSCRGAGREPPAATICLRPGRACWQWDKRIVKNSLFSPFSVSSFRRALTHLHFTSHYATLPINLQNASYYGD